MSASLPPVYATGIRSGEYVTSADGAKQNVGTIMQVFGTYPPSVGGIEGLEITDLRDKLPLIEFFRDLTSEQRLAWLHENSTTNNDLYLNDTKGLKVRFVTIGGTDMLAKFTPEQREWLLEQEEPISLKKVYRMADSGRKNLLFRPTNWKIYVEEYKDVKFSGYVVDIESRSISKYKGVLNTAKYVIVGSIAILVPVTPAYTPKELGNLINDEYEELIRWFSPSVHKSLIQKIVRTRSPTMNYLDMVVDSSQLLATSFCMLLRHPGTFDPVLGRHTSGLESAAKRLAVTIAEDSYVVDPWDLLSLYAAGYLAKKRKHWKPSLKLIQQWIAVGIEAYNTPRMYLYSTQELVLEETTENPLNLCYHLLLATKSFATDIYMMAHIANNASAGSGHGDNAGVTNSDYTHTTAVTVPILHCLDHHNIRDIAWHFPYSTLTTYSKLFKKIWDASSSINPRKRDYPADVQESEFMLQLRQAQLEIWMLHYQELQQRPTLKKMGMYTENFSLDESWLSALVGPRDSSVTVERDGESKRITVVCIIDPADITKFIVVPKPARTAIKIGDTEAKELILSDEEKDLATVKFQKELRGGVRGIVPPSIRPVVGSVEITYRKGTYRVNDVAWSKFRNISVSIPYHPPIDTTIANACVWTGSGIEPDAGTKALYALLALDTDTRNRLITYIIPVQSQLHLYPIDLHGGGTYYSVDITDSAVYEYLCKLCILFPAFLETTASGFKIKYGPGAWRVFREIREILHLTTPSGGYTWPMPIRDNLPLMTHQVEAVDKMNTGGHCHLIYILAGMGKTRIVMEYIAWLIEQGKMPKYCVYTLPKSAIKSVTKELRKYQYRINLLNLNQTNANTEVRRGYINLIEHDQLRKRDFKTVLGELANDLFFVVDEFHLTLSETTQRTANALSIARLAKYAIGMTGTLVTNKNAKPVIEWLSIVAKFEVTLQNYWCALGLLIASRVTTDVKIHNREVVLEMLPEDQQKHDEYMETDRYLDAVKLCYTVIQNALVKEALRYIRRGVGVFVVAKDKAMQSYIYEGILDRLPKASVFLIGVDGSLNYDTSSKVWYDAVITTPRHSTGYTLTKLYTTIQSVYFGNEATRTQLRARTNRLGQEHEIEIVTIHTGVLTYTREKQDKIASLAEFIAGFAKVVK
jgi:hypothetical protein